MKRIVMTCVLIWGLALTAYAGKPGTGGGCVDTPISWTFVATSSAPAAIWNDDPMKVYKNGTDGVSNAVIHCGSSDATLTLTRAKRSVMIQFPNPIPGSVIYGTPPSFSGGNTISAKPHLRVANILGSTVLEPGVSATFYTRLAVSFEGSDRKNYGLRFLPDAFTCPGDAPCVPDIHAGAPPAIINDPNQTAWVKVTYTARNRALPWSTTNTDQWLVEGESSTDGIIQRGMLFCEGTHCGQYSMPFKILITALATLP